MRKLVKFVVELVCVGLVVGWLLWKYPEKIDTSITWIILIILWYLTWEFGLNSRLVRDRLAPIIKRCGYMTWIIAFVLGGVLSTAYLASVRFGLAQLARVPAKDTPEKSPSEELHARVVSASFGLVYQFFQHPPVYFKRLDTSLLVSVTNQTDKPLYLRRYVVSAFVGDRWITFENADSGAYWADSFGVTLPPVDPKFIRRFDLSENGFDYVMNQRPLNPHENLRLWMFFLSGLGGIRGLSIPASDIKRFKISFYDSTDKEYVCSTEFHDTPFTVGGEGSKADLKALGLEPLPPNLREEPPVRRNDQ